MTSTGSTGSGDTHESAFEGLRRAFDTAVALRDGGLEFVVAPIPTSRGETVRRIGPRHRIALFPFVAGQAGRFGHYDPAERAPVVKMLAELHRATPAVASVANTFVLDLPGRPRLEAALGEVSRTWVGGPFSEPARQALARHASDVVELLALADRLAADLAPRRDTWVITHGEPHAGNVMRAGESRLLVDWDTVALGPPERDLWMVVGDGADEATSMRMRPAAKSTTPPSTSSVSPGTSKTSPASSTSFGHRIVAATDTVKAYEAVTHADVSGSEPLSV